MFSFIEIFLKKLRDEFYLTKYEWGERLRGNKKILSRKDIKELLKKVDG